MERGELKILIREQLSKGKRTSEIARLLGTSPTYVSWVKSMTPGIFRRTTEECVYCNTLYIKKLSTQAFCDRRCQYLHYKESKERSAIDNMEIDYD